MGNYLEGDYLEEGNYLEEGDYLFCWLLSTIQ